MRNAINKKPILIVVLLFISVSLSAVDIRTGLFGIYDPVDSSLSKSVNTNKKDNFGFGITNDFEFNHFAITSDIRFKNVLDSVTYFSYRFKYPHMWLDLGAGFEIALEKPVRGLNKYYLTSNGVALKNIFKIKDRHLVALAGMIRLRVSAGYNITDKISVRFDNSLNPYACVMLYPEGSVLDFIGLNDLILAVTYRW